MQKMLKWLLPTLLVVVVLATVLSGSVGCSKSVKTVTKVVKEKQPEAEQMQLLKVAFNSDPIQPAMPDHKIMELKDGSLIFLHFDKDASEPEAKLMYVGTAVPGVFTKADQERVTEKYGEGFTHFHQKQGALGSTPDANHGGKGGEKGYWFRHIAVTQLDMPWGKVEPGIDNKFMPTNPPK